MASIPKRISNRFIKEVGRFKKVLQDARDRDINESDTVRIVSDILCEVFGFDKYTEITREYGISKTYCDLAVKFGGEIKYLIEAKSINTDLKEGHLRQVVNYGANEGIQWVVLTNGLIWKIYNISLKRKVKHSKLFEIDFLNINPRIIADQELLFLLTKRGFHKDAIADYHERIKIVNPHVICAILINNPSLNLIRKELKQLVPKLRIDTEEITALLINEVLKRNLLEGEEASKAQKQYKKLLTRKSKSVARDRHAPPEQEKPVEESEKNH